jgi:CheY-like chemotaxis protein
MATILVVDDHPINRDFLVSLLGYQGHRLLEATDGAEALEVIRTVHPDLIISDILMPTMDGYEFVRRLRADPAIAKTAGIFYTANYLEREALAMAQACSVSEILSKPCEPAEVMRTVEAVLQLSAPTAQRSRSHSPHRDGPRVPTDQVPQSMPELVVDKLCLLALIDFRQELAAERNPQRLLDGFCHAARELIGAWLPCHAGCSRSRRMTVVTSPESGTMRSGNCSPGSNCRWKHAYGYTMLRCTSAWGKPKPWSAS